MNRKRVSGFTLIEILTSISVLLILVVLTSQLVGAVSSIFRSGRARIDTFNQARIVFGALDRDIRQMVLRSDLAAFPDDTGDTSVTGNKAACAFYTRNQGVLGDRAVSLVEYRIGDPTNSGNPSTPPVLMRRNYGMDFNTLPTTRVMTFGDSTKLVDLQNSAVDSRELSKGVVRLSWRFIDATGAVRDSFVFNYDDPNATTNTKVVRLSLLVLDEISYNLLIQTGQLATLLTKTGDAPAAGESCGQYWERVINTPGLLPDSIPKTVRSSIRVFEHSAFIPVSR